MRAVRIAAAGFLSLSLATLWAADAGTPSIDEIVQKNTEARGGLDRIRAVQTRKMVGTAQINGSMQAEITVQAKRPNLFRMDMNLPQGSLVEAFDGTSAWGINPFTGAGTPEKHDAALTRSASDDADMDGPLVDYKTKGTKVELLGVEDLAGSPAYKLRVTAKGGTVSTVWIDRKSWQEVKMTQTRQQNGQDVEVSTMFSNFKPVDGEIVPLTLDQQIGPLSMKVAFASAEANKPIDDAVFRMPSATPTAPPAATQ